MASFSIDTLGRPAGEFDVVVSGPGARALPVRCYQTKSGLLQAEFSINEVGQSTIGIIYFIAFCVDFTYNKNLSYRGSLDAIWFLVQEKLHNISLSNNIWRLVPQSI